MCSEICYWTWLNSWPSQKDCRCSATAVTPGVGPSFTLRNTLSRERGSADLKYRTSTGMLDRLQEMAAFRVGDDRFDDKERVGAALFLRKYNSFTPKLRRDLGDELYNEVQAFEREQDQVEEIASSEEEPESDEDEETKAARLARENARVDMLIKRKQRKNKLARENMKAEAQLEKKKKVLAQLAGLNKKNLVRGKQRK